MHMKQHLRTGEYSNDYSGAVLAHWYHTKSSPQYDAIDKNLFIKMIDHIYGNCDQKRCLFTKVGTNLYSGK